MKLLASDFDKTLFDQNYILNINAVNRFVDKGNMFIIATGRHLPRLLHDIKGYTIKYSYLVCNDGGVIYDNKLNCIYKASISNETTNNIIDYIKTKLNNTISDWFVDTTKVYTKDLKNDISAIILLFINKEKAEILLQDILKKFSDVDGYISDFHINLRPKGTSKANAINLIIKKEQIKKENVYTVGDHINDIEMIKEFNGYCMSISTEELKKVCKNQVNTVYELVDKIK